MADAIDPATDPATDPASDPQTDPATDPATPGSPTGGPATPPRVAPPLALYTLGRLLITVALVAAIWVAGLPGFPALLFGLLLSMPVAHVLLRGVRDRLTEALAARSIARRAAREELRTRLSGDAGDV